MKQFRIEYEPLHRQTKDAWCDCHVLDIDGVPLIVMTDCSDQHQSTSITNRVERAAYLAWEHLGRPVPCRFAERYPDRPDELDEVVFEPTLQDGSIGWHNVMSFHHPKWGRMQLADSELGELRL